MGNYSPVSEDPNSARFLVTLQTDRCLILFRLASLVPLPLRINDFITLIKYIFLPDLYFLFCSGQSLLNW